MDAKKTTVSVLSAIVGVAAFVGAWQLTAALFPSKTPDVEKAALGNPVYGPLYQELKADFPADWTQFKAAFTGPNAPKTEAEGFKTGHDFMAAFMAREMPSAAGASDARLAEFAGKSLSAVQALARADASVCAAYARTGVIPESAANTLSPDAMKAVVAMEVAGLHAAKEGRAAPVRHEPITPDQVKAIMAAFAAHGGSPQEAAALTSGSLASIPDARQCPVAIAFSQAVLDQPQKVVGDFYAQSIPAMLKK